VAGAPSRGAWRSVGWSSGSPFAAMAEMLMMPLWSVVNLASLEGVRTVSLLFRKW